MPVTMRLFLVRHGETVDNVAGLYAGSRDSALTAHGALQARRLASHLASKVTIKHLFSSNLKRAVRTAELVCDAQKRAHQTDLLTMQVADLREKDFGTGEGTKMGASKHEGAETYAAMKARVNRFIEYHLVPVLSIDDGAVCIVSHGILLGVLFKALSTHFPSISIAPAARTGMFPDVAALSRLWWANTGYLEGVMTSATPKPGKLPMRLCIETINGMDHVKGLKKTRGGIGSARFDDKQTTVESFFTSAGRKRKHDELKNW